MSNTKVDSLQLLFVSFNIKKMTPMEVYINPQLSLYTGACNSQDQNDDMVGWRFWLCLDRFSFQFTDRSDCIIKVTLVSPRPPSCFGKHTFSHATLIHPFPKKMIKTLLNCFKYLLQHDEYVGPETLNVVHNGLKYLKPS